MSKTSHIPDVRKNAVDILNESVLSLEGIGIESLIERFVLHATTNLGPLDGYKTFPKPCHEIVEHVSTRFGVTGVRFFLKGTISASIVNLIDSGRLKSLPQRVFEQQLAHIKRMIDNKDMQETWLDINNDLFHKEFGLASLRLYAAGAQVVDFRRGVPRSAILKEGILRSSKNLLFMMKSGGFKPYFEIHTHKFHLEAFNERGWEECYRCCADLYDLHPNCLGMSGSSWFYDPHLELISPRLSYLTKTPLNGGAKIMFFEEGGQAIDNALSTSMTRRKLYEEGKYLPKSYMLVWRKRDQVAWANTRRHA
ncbi:hypothetical protein [Noviherbaspirillum sp.]|uniref:hypothetical protein n=1 Tax=Noviherbaspirillum sp. TaxID=1926288 RepID=UPI002FE3D9DA